MMSRGLSASHRGGAHRGPGAGAEAGVGELRPHLLLPDGTDNKKMIIILYQTVREIIHTPVHVNLMTGIIELMVLHNFLSVSLLLRRMAG